MNLYDEQMRYSHYHCISFGTYMNAKYTQSGLLLFSKPNSFWPDSFILCSEIISMMIRVCQKHDISFSGLSHCNTVYSWRERCFSGWQPLAPKSPYNSQMLRPKSPYNPDRNRLIIHRCSDPRSPWPSEIRAENATIFGHMSKLYRMMQMSPLFVVKPAVSCSSLRTYSRCCNVKKAYVGFNIIIHIMCHASQQ